MVKSKYNILVLFVFLMIFIGYCMINMIYPARKKQIAENDKHWYAAYQQGKRNNSFSSCDATDELIYFAYSEKSSFIDAYDCSGNFQFTLFFQDAPNGVLRIRCQDGLLYVRTKSHAVFVFNHDVEIQRMTHTEALKNGYTNSWFEEANKNLYIENDHAYIVDSQGNVLSKFFLAQTVTAGISYKVVSTIMMSTLVLVVILVSVFRNGKNQLGKKYRGRLV